MPLAASTVRTLAQQLAHAVTSAEAIRQLLDRLGPLSGLDCVYLALLEHHGRRQRVQLVHQCRDDPGAVAVPEGATTDWEATLCRRALATGVTYTARAADWWDQSPPAAAAGVHTFMSHTIQDADGRLLGTLCGAGHAAVPEAPGVRETLALFAALVGCYLQRDRALADVWEQCEARVAAVLGARLEPAAAVGIEAGIGADPGAGGEIEPTTETPAAPAFA